MKLLSRNEIKPLSSEELMKALQESIDANKKEFDSITEKEKLENLEEELMKFFDENEKYVKTLEYELPSEAVFEGEHFSKKDVAILIVMFLNRGEYKWEYTQGAYDLVKFWKSKDPKKIRYGVYDSTLRMLNQLSFKGFQDWRDILTINEYMKGCHDAYTHDTGYTIYLAEIHNAITERMQLTSKPAERVDETQG